MRGKKWLTEIKSHPSIHLLLFSRNKNYTLKSILYTFKITKFKWKYIINELILGLWQFGQLCYCIRLCCLTWNVNVSLSQQKCFVAGSILNLWKIGLWQLPLCYNKQSSTDTFKKKTKIHLEILFSGNHQFTVNTEIMLYTSHSQSQESCGPLKNQKIQWGQPNLKLLRPENSIFFFEKNLIKLQEKNFFEYFIPKPNSRRLLSIKC